MGLGLPHDGYLWGLAWDLEATRKERALGRHSGQGKLHSGQEAAMTKMVKTDVFSVGRYRNQETGSLSEVRL